MDIGTLTGQVAIEDQMTDQLTVIAEHVKDFAEGFEGLLGATAVSVGVVTAAIVGMTISITELGDKGANINDVKATLDQFAGSATNAEEIVGKMRQGVLGTVGDFELAKDASRLLSANVKLSADQFGELTQAAFVLQNRGLGSTKEMMDLVTSAMITGRTRTLAMKLGVVDVKDSTLEFAKSLGVTVDQLTAEGVAEGKRLGIMKMLEEANRKAGVQQRDFGEQLEFLTTTIENWVDELASAVAASPNVMKAVDAIGSALGEAFGTYNKSLMEGILNTINAFADGVTRAVPYVVSFAKGVGSLIQFLYEYRIIVEGVVAALVLYNSTALLATVATTRMLFPFQLLVSQIEIFGVSVGISTTATYLWSVATTTLTGAVRTLWAVLAANPLIAVAAGFAALTLAYTQWRAATADAAVEAETLGAKQDSINKAIKDGAATTISYADAIAYNAEHLRIARGDAKDLSSALADLQSMSGNTHTQISELNKTVLDLSQKGGLSTPVVNQIASALKAAKIPADELTPALQNIVKAAKIMSDDDGHGFVKLGSVSKEAAAAAKALAEELKKIHDSLTGFADIQAFDKMKKAMGGQIDLSKLTAAGLMQVKKATDDAIAGYHAMGRDAPQDVQKVSAEVADLLKFHKSLDTMLVGLKIRYSDVALASRSLAGPVAIQAIDPGEHLDRSKLALDWDYIVKNSTASLKMMADSAANTYRYMTEHSSQFTKQAIDDAKRLAEEADKAFKGTSHSLVNSLMEDFKQVPGMIVQAFTGGGNIAGAFKGIGTMLASTIGESIGKSFASLGSLGGPIGSAIGSLAGPLIDVFTKMFSTAGRKSVEAFAGSFGGFPSLHKKLLDELGAVGENFWIELTQKIARGDKAGAQAIEDAISQAFADAKSHSPAALAEAAGYKTIDQLKELAAQAEKTYEYMRDSGMYTAEAVADAFKKAHDAQMAAMDETSRAAVDAATKARDEAQKTLDALDSQIKSLQQSVDAEAPEEYMGAIEAAQRAQLEQLQKEREAQQAKVDDLNDQIKNIVDAAASATADAAKAAGEAAVIGIQGALDEHTFHGKLVLTTEKSDPAAAMAGGGTVPSYYANGGAVAWTPRGTDTVPAMLTPGETVIPAGQQRRTDQPVDNHITVQVGSETIAKVVVRTFVEAGL